VVWAQEEPENMGAWRFASLQLANELAPTQKLRYAGRPENASPATGSHKAHEMEQKTLLTVAFANPANK
jgi:2-oxoglutarate dehydrogenase E1 component